MAQKLITPQIPESFKGLLSNGKVVQNSILERTEKKVSLLEGRQSVTLYSKSGTPPSLNHELDISSPNFIALGESYFIVKLKYTVKNNMKSSPGEYTNWICPTSPAFSWFKNVRVELDGTEVTQISKVSNMQIVQHIMSLMESSIGKLQYSDSDLFGLQKLDPRKSLKRIPLANYEYGAKRRKGYAFETAKNHDSADDAPDFKADYSLKRAPTIPLEAFEGYGNTVLENVVRVLSGHFQFKMRPFIPFFNVDDAWLPPRTQVKIKFDLPQTELSRYMIVSDKGGGANSAGSVGPVDIELSQLDFVYPTYRMEKAYVDQVRLPKQLYFHTWCPRLVQKSLTDDAGTLELLHNADIPRKMILFLPTCVWLKTLLWMRKRWIPAIDWPWFMQTYPNFELASTTNLTLTTLSSSDGNALLEKPTAMELRTIMITTSPATCVVTTWFRSSLEKLTEPKYRSQLQIIAITTSWFRSIWTSIDTLTMKRLEATFPLTISLQKWQTHPLKHPVIKIALSRSICSV